jgi:hypothetical protein
MPNKTKISDVCDSLQVKKIHHFTDRKKNKSVKKCQQRTANLISGA